MLITNLKIENFRNYNKLNLNLNNNSANLRISELEVCYEKIFVFQEHPV